MIQVTVGTNTEKKTITVNPSKTLKEVLISEHIDFAKGDVYLDGEKLTAEKINKTFTDAGITSDCYLISVVKANGGF